MTVKLSTKNETRFGSKVTLYAAGTVNIAEDGTFEVESEEIAKEVENTYSDFFIVGGGKERIEEELEEELNKKSEEDELNQGNKNDIGLSEEDKDLLIKSLESKSREELNKLAAPFPGTEWRKLGKPELIEYLKSKL